MPRDRDTASPAPDTTPSSASSPAPAGDTLPTLADVRAARDRIAGGVLRTPLLRLPVQPEGGPVVFAKPENLQITGSFKLRGALNFLASMDPAIRAQGVVAYSSGNHAQGVAYAARHFGVPATIVIPEGAAEVKVAGTLALGATVVRCANDSQARMDTARAIVAEQGSTLVPPFDHAWIIAGQGTVGLEIAEDLPELANVLIPIGGGGLSAGVALAIASLRPDAKLFGVEPAFAADAHASLARGERVAWTAEQVNRTMADGVRTQQIGVINFALLRRHLDAIVTVTEDEIRSAAAWFATAAHLVVEPTGALSLAAWRALRERGGRDGLPELQPGPTVVVVSGGNIGAAGLRELLAPRG